MIGETILTISATMFGLGLISFWVIGHFLIWKDNKFVFFLMILADFLILGFVLRYFGI